MSDYGSLIICRNDNENYGRGMVRIQTKKTMAHSPNYADAVVGLTEVARRNFDFSVAIEPVGVGQSFLDWAREMAGLHGPGLTYR